MCLGTYRRSEGIQEEWVRPVDMYCPFNQSHKQDRTELVLHFL